MRNYCPVSRGTGPRLPGVLGPRTSAPSVDRTPDSPVSIAGVHHRSTAQTRGPLRRRLVLFDLVFGAVLPARDGFVLAGHTHLFRHPHEGAPVVVDGRTRF